ncbi:Intracellular exo-alpha-L-arabinofuranosidase 2 [compost metagenome]
MYKVHQDNELLEVSFESPVYSMGEESIPQLSVSASRDASGKVYVSICNISHADNAALSIELVGTSARTINGQILTHSDLNAHNTFETPATVAPAVFEGASLKNGVLDCQLPPASVVVLTLE